MAFSRTCGDWRPRCARCWALAGASAPAPVGAPRAAHPSAPAWARVGLAGAILLAAVLRLARLDLAEFKADESTWLRLAEDLARLGRVPLDGPLSSQGIPAAPHFVYLLAPLAAVARDPEAVTAAVALANVAAVAGAVRLGWLGFGPLAGVVAGLLFAANPAAVFFGRKVWAPDLLGPMAVLFFLALDRGLVGRRAGWAAAALPLAVLSSLVHFAFAVFLPLALAPLWWLARGRRWGLLAAASVASVLVALPYLVHLLATRFEDVKNLRYYAAQRPPGVDGDALGFALAAATGWGPPRLVEVPLEGVLPAGVPWLAAAMLTALLGVGVGVAVWRLARPTERERATSLRLLGLLAWLLLPVLPTVRHSVPLHPHYYATEYPAPYLLVGASLAWLHGLGRPWSRAAARLALAGVGVVVVLNVATVAGFLGDLARRFEPCYDAPLGATRATADGLAGMAEASGSRRVAVEDDEADAAPVAYLLRAGVPNVLLAGVGEVGLGASGSAGRGDGFGGAPQVVDLRYPSGVRLRGAAAFDDPLAGWRVRLALDWEAEAGAASAHPVSWGVEVVDADGQAVARRVGVDHVPARLAGERVVSWFTVDTPRESGRGPHRVRVRLLNDDTGQVLAFRDGAGGGGEAWESGPLTLAPTGRCRASAAE